VSTKSVKLFAGSMLDNLALKDLVFTEQAAQDQRTNWLLPHGAPAEIFAEEVIRCTARPTTGSLFGIDLINEMGKLFFARWFHTVRSQWLDQRQQGERGKRSNR
jgi:hypothetical protein